MKLMQRLKMLPAKEYSAFGAFLNNALFNKRPDVIALFDFLKNQGPAPFEPQKAFAKLNISAAFTDTGWHLLCSRLLKLLEDYFAHRQLQGLGVEKKIHLANFFRQEKQTKNFQKAMDSAFKELEKSTFRAEGYWLQKHGLLESKYDYIESQNRTAKTNLQAVSDTLDVFFIVSKLKLAARQISRAIINSEEYEIHLLAAVLAEIKERPELLNIPAIAMYYYCHEAIAPQGSEKDFAVLRAAINEHAANFSPLDLRDIYFIAINFCIQKINRGRKTFNKEAFEFYRLSLQQNLLIEDGFFPESTFNNIIALAIDQQEYDWAEDFINQNTPQLKPSLQTSMRAFGHGKILFAQGNFDECLSTLAQISANVPFIYLGARTIQLKIYYENQTWDALDSLLDALRVYVQRRKDLGYRKLNYQNLIAFTRKLLQQGAMNRSERKQLREEIIGAEMLSERKWFLEKLKAAC